MVRWALVAALAVALVACGSSYKNKDYAAMNRIPMRSVCVGRMLVDLPKGGRWDWQQHFDFAEVLRLSRGINDLSEFWGMVEQKKKVFASSKHDTEASLLSGYIHIGDNAAMLLHRESASDVYGYDLDRYLWLGHWGYLFQSKALLENDQKNQFKNFDKIFKQLKPINNSEPPTERGFCIDSAMVVGKIGPIWSSPTITIGEWKDVYVNVIAHEDDGSRPVPSWQQGHHAPAARTPYEQLDGIKSWVAASERSNDDDRVVSFEVLRKRDTPLAGMDGQEIAVKAKLANGQEWYRFEWGSVGDHDRRDKSGFNAFLEAGDKDYTSNYAAPPPQDELLALWDAMLASLKPRPGAG